MRIGILGGTFNPVHNGHLYIAKQALKKLHLDRVIFIPTYIPPHKKIEGRVKANDRLHMLRLAIKGKEKFTISLYELRKRGKSYSIKTARYIKKKYGKFSKIFFLTGSDSLAELKSWKNIAKLMDMLEFVVLSRPGFKIKKGSLNILKINIPGKDISSTRIRRLLTEKKSIKGLVPKEVFNYIKKKNLYAE